MLKHIFKLKKSIYIIVRSFKQILPVIFPNQRRCIIDFNEILVWLKLYTMNTEALKWRMESRVMRRWREGPVRASRWEQSLEAEKRATGQDSSVKQPWVQDQFPKPLATYGPKETCFNLKISTDINISIFIKCLLWLSYMLKIRQYILQLYSASSLNKVIFLTADTYQCHCVSIIMVHIR